MSQDLENILEMTRDLSRVEQLQLIQAIIAIVQSEEEAGIDISEEWKKEIRARVGMADRGALKSKPWREVVDRLSNE